MVHLERQSIKGLVREEEYSEKAVSLLSDGFLATEQLNYLKAYTILYKEKDKSESYAGSYSCPTPSWS